MNFIRIFNRFIFFFFIINFSIHAQDSIVPIRSTWDIAQDLSKNSLIRQIGFPLDDALHLYRTPDLFRIAQQIVALEQEGALQSEIPDMDPISQIIAASRGLNTAYPLARVNLDTLKQAIPALHAYQMMAAFYIVSYTGKLTDMDVLLEYTLVYVGSAKEAEEMPDYAPGMPPAQPKKDDLTPQERLTLWPAAKAIVQNASRSIPLLESVVQNPMHPVYIRLRAAAFLKELAPNYLKNDLLTRVEPDMGDQIECLMQGEYTWKNILPNVCADLRLRERAWRMLISENVNSATDS